MVTRREFLDALAVGAAAVAVGTTAESYGQILGSNDRLNFAVIGLNGRAYAHLASLKANRSAARISHVCDVDGDILKKFAERTQQEMGEAPVAEKDFRKILEEKNVDAITIATPEHWHTPMAIAGLQAGKFHRATICVSSQVGCAVDCHFCMTALLGLKRNLTAGEIVGQVLAVLSERNVDVESERINLVFMGQGEPFLNYDNFMKAVGLLSDPAGVGIPLSRMTVSTSGIVPRIYDFGKAELRPKLAISLNASDDETRTRLMPINKKWNLEKLMAAARQFPLRPRERLTFEYVLLDGVNDSEKNALEVAGLLRGLRAKVNLIALNPGPDIPFSTPAEGRVHQFQKILVESGIPAYIRRPRGLDIYAACGQLKRTVS